MKPKQRNPPTKKENKLEILTVADVLPDKLPLPKKKSEQQTDTADKQEIEKGKEKARDTVETGLSTVKKALNNLKSLEKDSQTKAPAQQKPLSESGSETPVSHPAIEKSNPVSAISKQNVPRQQNTLPLLEEEPVQVKKTSGAETTGREVRYHERPMPHDGSRTISVRTEPIGNGRIVPPRDTVYIGSVSEKKEPEEISVPRRARRETPKRETYSSRTEVEKLSFSAGQPKDASKGGRRSMENVRTRSPRTVHIRDDDMDSGAKIKTSGKEKDIGSTSNQAVKTARSTENVKEVGYAAAEAGKSAAETAKAAGEAAAETAKAAGEAAGQAASGAATGGVSTAVSAAEKAVKKAEEALRQFSREGKSPLGNDQGGVISILTTGGGIIGTLLASVGIFLLPILFVVFAASLLFSSAGNQNLSEGVTALLPQIQAACIKYEIPDYAPLVAAIMMQESGGDVELVHGDVMQCAEGMGLPVGTPVSTEESIDFGVKLLKGLLQQANVTSPADLDHLKLAVQAYNFGSGYIGYALAMDGKYTRENAVSFAQRQAGILGWSSYGDVDYVDHVLRYYTIGTGLGMGTVSQRYPTFCYPMPGYGWTTYSGHEGIDLPCELGTPVYASGTGTITYVKNGWTEADGKSGMMSYGNCVCISHDNGLETRYGHLSYAIVQSGQMVFQGQLIGYSGNTGNSTGPHMHFSIYDNGNPGSGGYSNNAALAFPHERQ